MGYDKQGAGELWQSFYDGFNSRIVHQIFIAGSRQLATVLDLAKVTTIV